MRILPLLLALGACTPRLYTDGPPTVANAWVAPQNGWSANQPPAELLGQGWEPGDTAPDVRGIDQHGDEVSLWQFYGKIILFDVSTMWCAPCRDLAAGTQETSEHYDPEHFVYLTVLQQNVEGEPPLLEDVEQWAEVFGIEAPVIEDGAAATAGAVLLDQLPAVLVINPDMTIRARVNPPSEAEVIRAIDEAFE